MFLVGGSHDQSKALFVWKQQVVNGSALFIIVLYAFLLHVLLWQY